MCKLLVVLLCISCLKAAWADDYSQMTGENYHCRNIRNRIDLMPDLYIITFKPEAALKEDLNITDPKLNARMQKDHFRKILQEYLKDKNVKLSEYETYAGRDPLVWHLKYKYRHPCVNRPGKHLSLEQCFAEIAFINNLMKKPLVKHVEPTGRVVVGRTLELGPGIRAED